jgi:hypothetical protein
MTNTSATGGYLSPTTTPLPGDLTFLQFIQTVLVGITGLDPKSVRPKWQKEPPKQLPNPDDDWLAFALIVTNPDANAYLQEVNNESRLQRHEDLQLICSFYGAHSNENAGILRDGFQVGQNRDVLATANVGFTGVSSESFVPEFINNRWFPRTDITLLLKRRVDRTYKILPFDSAAGTIEANKATDEIIDVPWNVTN